MPDVCFCTSSGTTQQTFARISHQGEAYNQDIKAAGYAASIQQEKEKSAKADFLPSLSGNANFNYTGNPAELSVSYPFA